jgi:hypothetical protein
LTEGFGQVGSCGRGRPESIAPLALEVPLGVMTSSTVTMPSCVFAVVTAIPKGTWLASKSVTPAWRRGE